MGPTGDHGAAWASAHLTAEPATALAGKPGADVQASP